MSKRARLNVLERMADLFEYLGQAYRELPVPFGTKEDVLMPEHIHFEV